jgi:hypothetical protein
MSTTLATALDLSVQKQDVLLGKVLELWCTVHVLVDHELKWDIFEHSPDAPPPVPEDGSASDQQPPPEPQPHRTPIDPSTTTYQLLCMQLSAAVEKRSATLSKSILNDLERRLLQRSSTSSFETFLISLILLNCVEKSTWLFKSWEQDYLKARWPLDKTPVWYGGQGDRLTDMLGMLLRMRSCVPRTSVRLGDGVVVADGEEFVRAWFEKVGLTRKFYPFPVH